VEFAALFGDDVGGRAALIEGRDPFAGRAPPASVGDAIDPLSRMHCETVGVIVGRLDLPAPLTAAAEDYFESWDGAGHPARKSGEAIDPTARLVALAGDMEVAARLHGAAAVEPLLEATAGVRHDPALAASARRVALAPVFAAEDPWAEAASRLDEGPLSSDAAVRLLSDYAALKAPRRIGRADRLAAIAEGGAALAGSTAEAAARLGRAARLVDLGLVAVPSPKADDPEALRLVPYWTERILARAPALAEEGRLASFAFERLDGSGAHRGVAASAIDAEARLLQAALAVARCEERGEAPEEARAEAAAGALDETAVEAAIAAAAGRRASPPTAPSGLTRREVEVLALVARGMTNKEAARALGVSPKTVGAHVEAVYRKLGVSNRASAALKALELGIAGGG
ncbi:MAG: LuxR C-terminal-related transcriptional regulator, partial [Pseudomonadota bacterium]